MSNMSNKKNKKHYTTLYIPTSMYEMFKNCEGVLHDCDCNISQMFMILISCILKICLLITKMGKNYRHFKFEIVAKDYGTNQWITSNDEIVVRPKIQ